MNRAYINQLATYLSLIPPNQDTLLQFTDDIFKQLGMSPSSHMLKISMFPITSGISVYDFPNDALRIVAAFYQGKQVHIVTERDLEAYDTDWRISSDSPQVLIQHEDSVRSLTIYPIPDTTSAAIIPIHGEPFGEDYPDDMFTLIYTEDRIDDISDIFALPILFESLSREFNYPSAHTDTVFSELCLKLSQTIFKLIGVKNA